MNDNLGLGFLFLFLVLCLFGFLAPIQWAKIPGAFRAWRKRGKALTDEEIREVISGVVVPKKYKPVPLRSGFQVEFFSRKYSRWARGAQAVVRYWYDGFYCLQLVGQPNAEYFWRPENEVQIPGVSVKEERKNKRASITLHQSWRKRREAAALANAKLGRRIEAFTDKEIEAMISVAA